LKEAENKKLPYPALFDGKLTSIVLFSALFSPGNTKQCL